MTGALNELRKIDKMRGFAEHLIVFFARHQDNISVCFIPPYTPLLYSKTGRGLQGYTLFSYFSSKTYIVGTR